MKTQDVLWRAYSKSVENAVFLVQKHGVHRVTMTTPITFDMISLKALQHNHNRKDPVFYIKVHDYVSSSKLQTSSVFNAPSWKHWIFICKL